MSMRPILCLEEAVIRFEACAFCHTRQLTRPAPRLSSQKLPSSFNSSYKSGAPQQWNRRGYAVQVRGSWQEVRDEIDTKRRKGFYALMQRQGLLSMPSTTAEQVYTEFVSMRGVDARDKVLKLSKKYKLNLSTIMNLALATHRIPEAVDPSGRAPPSPHKRIAKDMLLGCSTAGEAGATFQILAAVLFRDVFPAARSLSELFSTIDIDTCRKTLDGLAENNSNERQEEQVQSLTLQGLFLEGEGKKRQAIKLYEKAMERMDIKPDNREAPLAMPRPAPWSPLGKLLMENNDLTSKERAKEVFEKGALNGDDPIAYYYLARLIDSKSDKWLSYMTKAAASGHADAMYSVAMFYADLSSHQSVESLVSNDKYLAKTLNWLTEWRRTAPANLAMEWLQAAVNKGHKPSMAALADRQEAIGNFDRTLELLTDVAAPPHKGETEKWPELVVAARNRLPALQARVIAKAT